MSWEWCRLKTLSAAQINSFVDGPFGSNLKTEHYTTNREVRIIQLNNIGAFEWRNTGTKYTTFEHAESLERCKTFPNDIVIAKMMPAGRAIIVPAIEELYVISSDCVRLRVAEGIVNKYLMYAINSPVVNSQVQDSVHGIGRSRTSLSKCKELLVPIPPAREQSSICISLNTIFSLLATVEITKEELSVETNSMKSKILDLAIRGKLVPQNPDDEPASVLLERIRAEKEELIKQGKIKRDKNESVIFKGEDNSYYEKIGKTIVDINDEMLFDCSDNCILVRLKDVCQLISGRDLKSNEYNDNSTGIPYLIGASNFTNGNLEINRWTDVPQAISKRNDLLITCKGTIGEMSINTLGDAHIARQIMAIRNIYNLNISYVAMCISFYIQHIKSVAKGLIPGISRDDVLNLILPIPSEQHQQLIVDKVKVFYDVLSNIERNIT